MTPHSNRNWFFLSNTSCQFLQLYPKDPQHTHLTMPIFRQRNNTNRFNGIRIPLLLELPPLTFHITVMIDHRATLPHCGVT